MTEWYAHYDGKEAGSLSKDQFLTFIKGKDPSALFVWREGFEKWISAAEIPSLAEHMRAEGISPLNANGVTPKVERDFRFNNIIARHWRGELPLWLSYWGIGFLGNIGVAIALPAIAIAFKTESGYYPLAIFASILATWAIVCLVVAWQIIGTWRSAKRYIEERQHGKGAFWGTLAQVALVLGGLSAAGNFFEYGAPQLRETFNIAFKDDPSIPSYSIRVMRDGTEAEIVGGFKYGLTDDFQKILKAARGIKVVHLDSAGGRLGEGEKLHRLISERGLDTYVSAKCMSACTLAFAAGKHRYLNKRAVLGFHRGAFPGIEESDLDEAQHRVFAASGFDAGFIRAALNIPHKDMWKPSADVLLKAGVITSIVDGEKFAISGFGDISREEISTKLASAAPSYAALKERFPKAYNSAVDEFYTALLKGKTEAAAIQSIRDQLIPMIAALIPLADDDVVVDFTRLMVAQYRALNELNPSHCYGYASGNSTTSRYFEHLPRQLVDLELKIQERVVRTARKRGNLDEGEIEALGTKLRSRLSERGATSEQFELLQAAKVPAARHKEYCQMAIALFDEVTKLPPQQTAVFMRSVLAK